MSILSNNEIEMLSTLHVLADYAPVGGLAGSFSAGDYGCGLDFAEYRAFNPGDDLKNIDWHHYLGKNLLVLKTFQKYETLRYSIFLDISGSVVAGGETKLMRVRQLAAATAFLVLAANCSVELFVPGLGSSGRFASSHYFSAVEDYIISLESADNDFLKCLQAEDFSRNPGPNIVISDMIANDGIEALKAGLDRWPVNITVFPVSTPWERSPVVSGACTVVDAETGSQLSLDISARVIADYRNIRERYFELFHNYALARGWRVYECCSDVRLVDFFSGITERGSIIL